MDPEPLDNVCYCKCHNNRKDRCPKCKVFHEGSTKPKTHHKDKRNPNIPVDEK